MSYVESGSIAAKAGLRFGDQIVQINGQAVAGTLNYYHSVTISFTNDKFRSDRAERLIIVIVNIYK